MTTSTLQHRLPPFKAGMGYTLKNVIGLLAVFTVIIVGTLILTGALFSLFRGFDVPAPGIAALSMIPRGMSLAPPWYWPILALVLGVLFYRMGRQRFYEMTLRKLWLELPKNLQTLGPILAEKQARLAAAHATPPLVFKGTKLGVDPFTPAGEAYYDRRCGNLLRAQSKLKKLTELIDFYAQQHRLEWLLDNAPFDTGAPAEHFKQVRDELVTELSAIIMRPDFY